MSRTVLITGTSSGLGRSAAEYFAEHAWNVVATMRKPACEAGEALAELPNVTVLALDVTDDKAIETAVATTLAKFGRLDALVNNAGIGLVGPMEFASAEQISRQVSTNLVGPIRLMQAVLPSMRAAKSGVIVNVTSVGGRMVVPLNSVYHGAKYGLEGASECAAIELAPFGVKVRLVEPGGIRTDFASRNMMFSSSETCRDYDSMVNNVVNKIGGIMDSGSDAIDIAKVVYEAVTHTGDKMRFPAGGDAYMMLEERATLSDEQYQQKAIERFNVSL